MQRRDFLRMTAAAAAGLTATRGAFAARTSGPPNVILVITDDQGYYDLRCHGNEVIDTPNIDKLHSDSVRLTNYHVDPTCAPTRSALMTGRYSSRTGVWHTIMGRSLLHRDEVTVADVFSAGKYKTAMFGKWHLGDNYPYRPGDRGFQHVICHGGGGVGQGPDYYGNDYFDDHYCVNGVWKPFKGYCTDIWFQSAIDFIDANKDKPFFAYVSTNAPHGPLNVDAKYSDPYLKKGEKANRAKFYGMVTNIDENMGKLMKYLDAEGLTDNTILIFTTDNGTAAGNPGPMRGKKGSEYEGGHRVPFLIRWPNGKLTGARDVDNLVAHVDIMPTLADLCGVKVPRKLDLDGMSLKPLLDGKAKNWPSRTLGVHSQRIELPEKWRKSSVMTDRWRLVNGKELFDIQADPSQKADIAKENPEVVQTLTEAYEGWYTHIGERFDDYCYISLGADEENPTRLMSHDIHAKRVPWSQGSVKGASMGLGFWAVDVEQSGDYEIELRRWAKEVDAPILAAAGGKAIKATAMRLKIADFDKTLPVDDGAKGVTFKMKLKKGKTKMTANFVDGEKETGSVYYAYVKRV